MHLLQIYCVLQTLGDTFIVWVQCHGVTESRPGHDPAKLMPSATCLVSTAAAVTVFVKSHILHLKKTFLCPSIMLQMSPKVHLSDITPAFPFRDKEIRK